MKKFSGEVARLSLASCTIPVTNRMVYRGFRIVVSSGGLEGKPDFGCFGFKSLLPAHGWFLEAGACRQEKFGTVFVQIGWKGDEFRGLEGFPG